MKLKKTLKLSGSNVIMYNAYYKQSCLSNLRAIGCFKIFSLITFPITSANVIAKNVKKVPMTAPLQGKPQILMSSVAMKQKQFSQQMVSSGSVSTQRNMLL